MRTCGIADADAHPARLDPGDAKRIEQLAYRTIDADSVQNVAVARIDEKAAAARLAIPCWQFASALKNCEHGKH